MKKISILLVLFLMIPSIQLSAKEVPTSADMILDMAVARPVGFTATVVGLGLFVIGAVPIPFYLMTPNPKQAVKNSFYRFVGYPAQYTFSRSFGEFPGYLDSREFSEE
jgi:hypothetical protein